VRCTDSDGRQFIVEMQLDWDESFKSRVLFNASKAYVMQVEKAQKIKLIHPVFALNFVNDIFEKSPEMKDVYLHHYKIVNIIDTQKQIKGLEFLFVELPKFKPQNRAERKLHDLWLRFLTEINESTKEIPAELLGNEYIREAVGYMERSAYSREELDRYYQWRIDTMTSTAMLENAEAKGKEEGRAEGREEERQKANMEREKDRKNTALKMIEDGMSIENIIKYTALTPEQIEQLIKGNF